MRRKMAGLRAMAGNDEEAVALHHQCSNRNLWRIVVPPLTSFRREP
jgi:hypothetical protein